MIVDLLPFEDVFEIVAERYDDLGYVIEQCGPPSAFFYSAGVFSISYVFALPEITYGKPSRKVTYEEAERVYTFKAGPQTLGKVKYDVRYPNDLGARHTFQNHRRMLGAMRYYRNHSEITKVPLRRYDPNDGYERTLKALQMVWGTEFKHFDRKGHLK